MRATERLLTRYPIQSCLDEDQHPLADPPYNGASSPDLSLDTLAERHPGLTPEVAATYAQAAAVCLSRHHEPPVAVRVSRDADEIADYAVTWDLPTQRVRAAWANADDATRDGAYCLVLAAAEGQLGLIAFSRASVRSGADYLMGRNTVIANPVDGLIDLEHAIHLEISGIDRCRGEFDLERRVQQKVQQVRGGSRGRPSMAGVVAFNMRRIVFRSVD